MDLLPEEMSDRIVTINERSITTTVNDIEHMESQSYNGIGVIKLFFRPSVTIATALAQVTAICQSQLRQLPPGTTAPLILSYSASTVPVLQVGSEQPAAERAAVVRSGRQHHPHPIGHRAGRVGSVAVRRQAAAGFDRHRFGGLASQRVCRRSMS